MKTEWDYTTLADAYLQRPDYSDAAIDSMLKIAGTSAGQPVCDVGAGVAHLTLMLGVRGFDVTAVEPNDAMRANGIKRTAAMANVRWHEGTGENTGQADEQFALVTFGSSFNVCDRPAALKETARILKPKGWFACMWNHRYLEDPIQSHIEGIIKSHIEGYNYGARREDQTAIINASGLFGPVTHLDSRVIHVQSIEDCVEAWRSHATLERQAGSAFGTIIEEIEGYLRGLDAASIQIPYTTNIWIAQLL
ncbi:methyltransferase family protein [Agrobacterium vitis]|nr:methyltransferase family protein [Agrobacterium vitis]